MKKGLHTLAVVICGINIIVNLLYAILGYANLMCFHQFEVDNSVGMLCVLLTILSAEILVAAIIGTPHLWMFRYVSDILETVKKEKECYVFRIIWLLLLLYCLLCFSQSYLLDKRVYETGQTPIIDCLTWSAFSLLINFEYLTYHMVTLKNNRMK